MIFPQVAFATGVKRGAPVLTLERRIQWKLQAVDSKSCPAPLGGSETGHNPTDRAKRGSKIHLLVDQRGVPLAVYVTGANRHDKWIAEELVIHIVVKRPTSEQHFCADKGYDNPDVHDFVLQEGYVTHLSTADDEVNLFRQSFVSCPVKLSILLAAGLLSVQSVG